MHVRAPAISDSFWVWAAVAVLTKCVAEAATDRQLHAVARKRLGEMLEFTSTVAEWHDQMSAVPRPKLMALLRLGARIINFLPGRKAT